jgi:hypothetical protein
MQSDLHILGFWVTSLAIIIIISFHIYIVTR